jgi:hypothetical protein
VPPITRLLGRRAGPLGLALAAYDLWNRLPEAHRRRLLEQTRKHGPRIAVAAVKHGTTQLRKRSR